MSCPLNSSCFCRFRSTSRCSAIYIEDDGGHRKRKREREFDLSATTNHIEVHHIYHAEI